MSLKHIMMKLSINEQAFKRLKEHRIITALDFLGCNKEDILKEGQLSKGDVDNIEQAIYAEHGSIPIRGITLYEETLRLMKILPTGCKNFDELLDGGLFTSEIIECFGPPASGKTQASLYITSAVISDHTLNVLYIDTTSSFTTKRLSQMIDGRNSSFSPKANEEVLSRVHCVRVFDAFTLISELENIKTKLKSEVDIFCLRLKLIVLDSIASIITPILGGKQYQGHAMMSKVGLLLKEIAHEFGIAVLVVNNAVSNYGEHDRGRKDIFKPSLGKSWLHVPNIRLFWNHSDNDGNERIITILKHPRLPESLSTSIYIGSEGLSSTKT